MRETENLNLLHLSPHPQNPKNLRKNPRNPSINLLDLFQIE